MLATQLSRVFPRTGSTLARKASAQPARLLAIHQNHDLPSKYSRSGCKNDIYRIISSWKSGGRRSYHSSGSRFRWQKSFILGGHESVPETPPDAPQSTVKYIFRLRRLAYFIIFCVGVFLVFAAVNGEEQVVPFTDRKRFAVLRRDQEEALGNHLAEDVIKKHEKAILPDNHPAVVQLSAIVDHICAVNGLGKRKLVLIVSAKPNAFVLGGKYIFVFTGLFKPLPTTDQVAFVMGHEIGHTLAGHWGEGLVRNGVATAAAIFLALFGGQPATSSSLMKMLMVLPKSRVNEKEADEIGLYLASKACVNPSAALSVCDNLAKANGEGGGYTSTHPAWMERKKNLQELMESEKFNKFLRDNNSCPRAVQPHKVAPVPEPPPPKKKTEEKEKEGAKEKKSP